MFDPFQNMWKQDSFGIPRLNLFEGPQLPVVQNTPQEPLVNPALAEFILPAQGKITSEFGVNRGNHTHSGIDIGVSMGTPVKAARSGIVKFAGKKGNYGNTVIVDHLDGTETLYAHASKLLSKIGQQVNAGQPIAAAGSTGRSTGPHVHFEVRQGGKAVDPKKLLGKVFKQGLGGLKKNANAALAVAGQLEHNEGIDVKGMIQSLLPKTPEAIAPVMKPMLDKVFNLQGLLGNLGNAMIPPAQAAPIQSGFKTPALAPANVGGDIPKLIIQYANKMGVPPALALAVARAESGFNPKAVSPAGARGVFQLMPATARGLGVNPDDLHGNIQGGVKYIKQLYDQFGGDITDVLAGYNAGPAAAKSGKWRKYRETRNYVNKVRRFMK